MANNPYVNEVKYGNQTVMSLKEDTVTPSDVLQGKTFHDRSGAPQTGSFVAHEIKPTPNANLTESDIVTVVNAGLIEGGANDDVPSLFGIGKWSNAMVKTFLVQGVAGDNTPIGTTGIGTWPSDPKNPTVAEKADWICIPELYGCGSVASIDVVPVFDPATVSYPIILGGYVIDDNETMSDGQGGTINCAKMCIKFGNELPDEDTHTAIVGAEVTLKRTEVVFVG